MPWGSPVVLPREPENPWSAALRQLTMNAALQHMQNVQSTRAAEAQRAFEKEQSELQRTNAMDIARMQLMGKLAGQSGPYKVGQLRDFKEGDEFVTKEWLGADKGWQEVSRAPRYKPGETNVSVDVGSKGMQELAEKMSGNLVESRTNALDALKALEASEQAKKMLDEGMITGFGANFLVSAGNALHQMGINLDVDPIANSQAYGSVMAKQVAQIIKAFGAGTGLSDADREYALKAAAGDINMTEEALRKVMRINREASQNALKFYNNMADQAMSRPGADMLPYDLRIEVPEQYYTPWSESKQGKSGGKMTADQYKQKWDK